MASWLSAFAFILLISSVSAITDGPFIIAHKKASLSRIKPKVERVSVYIDIYNEGTTVVYDVSLNDNIWPIESFTLVSGNLSTSWEKLDVGSVVSHSFELEAKEKGLFHNAPAVFKFCIPTESVLQEAYSTPLEPLDILAGRVSEDKLKLRLLDNYGSKVAAVSLVALFIVLISSPSKSSNSKGSQKRR